jgi:hypothetical protein
VSDQDTTEHADFMSPSSSKKLFACPGSRVLERDFPNKSSTYSDDGTAMHAIAARVLTTSGTVAEQYVHELVPVHYKTEPPRYVRFTSDMADMVDEYVTTLRAIAAGEPILVEQRVNFSEFIGVPNQFGTLDAGIHFLMEGEIFIGDLKTGHTPVEVEENSQLMLYGLGFLRRLLDNDLSTAETDPFAYARALGVTSIRLGIFQPKTTGGWTEWKCTLDDLQAFAGLARSKADTAKGAEEMFDKWPREQWDAVYLNPNPNDKECAFCRAMAVCPSVRRKLEQTVGAEFGVVAESPPTAGPDTAVDRLAQAMTVAPLAEDFFKAVRAETERRLLAGQEVPGFGLELGRKGARKFTDPAEAERIMRKVWRLTIEDVYQLELKTPTALEKLTKPLKTVDEAGQPVVAKPIIGPRRWKELCDMVVQADPKPSVKPLKDIKTPYKPTAPSGDEFSTVKE